MVAAPRRDALPEEHPFSDEGCRYCPKALDCPYSECIEEVEEDRPREEKLAEWEERVALTKRLIAAKQLTTAQIAARTGFDERTVWRWKKRLKRDEA